MTRHLAGIGAALIGTGAILTVGFIGFGPPMVLAGVLLIFISRWRALPTRLLAILIGSVAGLTTWYAVMPLGCSVTPVRVGSSASTLSCTTLFGWTSPGSIWAVIAGVAVGLAVILLLLSAHHRSATFAGQPN